MKPLLLGVTLLVAAAAVLATFQPAIAAPSLASHTGIDRIDTSRPINIAVLATTAR